MQMRCFTALLAALLLAAVAGFSNTQAAELCAGVAKVDITDRAAGPVNDPLFAKALVLKRGETTVVLITVDAVAIGEIGRIGNGFLAEVRAKGDYLHEKLQLLAARFPALVTKARGLGLIQGLVLTEAGVEKGGAIVTRMFEKGCLINFAGNVALRFLPPLIVSREEIDQMFQLLAEVLGEI